MKSLKISLLTIAAAIAFSATTYAQTSQLPSAKALQHANSESAIPTNKSTAPPVKQTATAPHAVVSSEAPVLLPQVKANGDSKVIKTPHVSTTSSEAKPINLSVAK